MVLRELNELGSMMGWRTARTLVLIGAGALAATGCAQMPRMAFSPCHNTTVTLYFETASDTVTDVGQQIVGITAKRLKSCPVKDLKLLGLADSSGQAAANLDLSKRRAQNVLDAFVKAGLAVPHFTLVAAGDKGAVAPSGAVEPLRRQVDVTVVVGR